jgi:hypothetical protein
MSVALLAGAELFARATNYSAASTLMFKAAMVLIALGAILGSFPLWKSATLSPDSIERRTYWIACTIAVVLIFLAELPHWATALFASIAVGITLVCIAGMWTSHVKINGRIYAGLASNRGPDRPPALAEQDDSE